MKKMIFVILMCVAKFATAQEVSPLVPYKPGKANHSIIEMEQKLKGNSSIVKNWGAVIERAAWRDGWAHEVSPEFFQEKYIVFCLRKSFQVKKNFQKGDFATFGTKSDGELVSTERDPYTGELFLELDPNDLETETFSLSKDYPPFVYASSVCMNGVDVYAKQVNSASVSPTPRLNRNNDGYAQVPPSAGAQKYAEPEFAEAEKTSGNTYITNNYFSDEGEINYEQDEYGEYQDSRLSFWFSLNISAGPIYVNPYSNYGYVGNQPGYYNGNYSQPYVCIGNQGYNGVPSISNVSYFNQTVNNIYNYNYNYNYNSTTIITNPPPVSPVTGNPIHPPNGGIAYTPIDPLNRTHAGFAKNKGIAPVRGIKETPTVQTRGFANNSDSRPKTNSNPKTTFADTRPSSRPESRPSQKPPNQFTRGPQQDQSQANSAPQSRPKENRGNYNQGSPKSNFQTNQQPRQAPSSRPSYSNSGPSRPTAHNTGQSNRGSAPTGGRGNFGGGNTGGRSR